MKLLPIRPDPARSGWSMFAVTWVGQDGSEWTRLVVATSHEEAARYVTTLDNLNPLRPIDVRKCEPVRVFRVETQVMGEQP